MPLGPGGKVVLHLVPVPAFADGRLLDVVSAVAAGTHLPLPLDGMGAGNRPGHNIDGFLNYADRPAGGRQSYAQFFRSGAIEGVGNLSKREADGNPYFVSTHFKNKVVLAVRQYLNVLQAFDAGLPVYAFLSLCDVAQCFYRYSPDGASWSDAGPLNRDILALPELYIDNFRTDVPALMRPSVQHALECVRFSAVRNVRRTGRLERQVTSARLFGVLFLPKMSGNEKSSKRELLRTLFDVYARALPPARFHEPPAHWATDLYLHGINMGPPTAWGELNVA